MSGVGTCEFPLRLERQVLDVRTGELTRKEMYKRCGNRRASECPSCSELFRGDAIAVLRSGLYDANGKQRAATWVTLTAPGADVFGPTHSQRKRAGRIGVCRCGERHQDGDDLIGTPLNPATYRYDLAADFNMKASRLATVTFQKIGRMLGRKLQVMRVIEYQARGLVHVHALVLGTVTQRTLRVAVEGGTNLRTRRTIAAAEHGGWSWGPQCKADLITAGSGHKLGAYMTKVVRYATKAAGDELPNGSPHAGRMESAGESSATCDHPLPVCRSGDPYMHRRIFVAPAEGPAEVAMDSQRYQSRPSRFPCRRHRAASKGWGFRGHLFSTSRTWGLSFSEVRARRGEYRSGGGAPPEHLDIRWTLLGRGYGTEGLRLSDLDDPP